MDPGFRRDDEFAVCASEDALEHLL